jgi:hypothetical protein
MRLWAKSVVIFVRDHGVPIYIMLRLPAVCFISLWAFFAGQGKPIAAINWRLLSILHHTLWRAHGAAA